jgi:hypothetical protein
LNAHGAGVIKVDGRWYLVGEDKTNGSAFVNVNCYSSTNLVQWTYEGALISRTDSGDLGPNRIVERPKVIYNDKTEKYVLWFHADSSSYGDAKVGVATGDTVCGKYSMLSTYHVAMTIANTKAMKRISEAFSPWDTRVEIWACSRTMMDRPTCSLKM